MDQIPGIRRDPGDPGDPTGSGDGLFFSHFRCVLQYFVTRVTLRCDVFLTFSYPSHLKPTVLRCFLDNDLPKTVSKGMIPLRRSLKKSKKHRAIAPAALGGCGGLGQLWEALAELREALGELWEGLDC